MAIFHFTWICLLNWFKLQRRFEVVFWCLEWECCTLKAWWKFIKIHQYYTMALIVQTVNLHKTMHASSPQESRQIDKLSVTFFNVFTYKFNIFFCSWQAQRHDHKQQLCYYKAVKIHLFFLLFFFCFLHVCSDSPFPKPLHSWAGAIWFLFLKVNYSSYKFLFSCI